MSTTIDSKNNAGTSMFRQIGQWWWWQWWRQGTKTVARATATAATMMATATTDDGNNGGYNDAKRWQRQWGWQQQQHRQSNENNDKDNRGGRRHRSRIDNWPLRHDDAFVESSSKTDSTHGKKQNIRNKVKTERKKQTRSKIWIGSPANRSRFRTKSQKMGLVKIWTR